MKEDAEKSSERVENLMKRDEAEPSERAQKKLKPQIKEQVKSNVSKLRCQMVLPSTAYSNYRTGPLVRV